MNLNFKALCFLGAWERRLPIPDGLAFESLLRACRLDYSVQSLARVDVFLDALRKTSKIKEATYLDDPAAQNMLYLLAFYVGEVIGRSLGHAPQWLTYDEGLALNPGSQPFGTDFENSLNLAFPTLPGTKTFCPFTPIASRLFSMQNQKSVLTSASAFIPPQAQEARAAQKPLPPVPPAAGPVDAAQQARLRAGELTLAVEPPPLAADDALRRLFESAPALLREGRVVWGALVHANSALMTPGPVPGATGDVLYDPSGRAPPDEISAVASLVFSLKGKRLDDPALAYFSDFLADEDPRVFGIDVPGSIVPFPLQVSTTYFDRQHLPSGVLAQRCLPLLVSDAHPGLVLPLPGALWPPVLLQAWSPSATKATPAPVAPSVAVPAAPGGPAREDAAKPGLLGKLFGR